MTAPPVTNVGTTLWHIGWAGVDGESEFTWRTNQGMQVQTPITPLGPNHYMYFWGPDRELIEVYTGSKNHRFEHVHLLASNLSATLHWFREHPVTNLRTAVPATLFILAFGPSMASAQSSLDSLLTPHRAAMASLVVLDGLWRGDGWTLLPTGAKATFRQTIRVGSSGEGALKVIEGRGFNMDGQLSATNFEVVSFNADTKVYTLRLYAEGNAADVPIVPTPTGFVLEYPDGTATVRFTIVVTDGGWNEIAERRVAGQEPVRFLELSLRRVGDD